MKNLFLLLLVSALTFPATGQGIDFQNLTVEQAVAKAKAENKHIFVDVYTNWCGPCKMMDAQVFPLKEIGDYFNPRFISLKMNAEVGEEGPAFAEAHGIKAYPTFVILDGNGDMVHMFAGGILNLTFIDKVEASFDENIAFGSLKKRYDAGERNPAFVASYLEALQNTHTVDIKEMLEEFYGSLSDEDKICAECLFIFDGYAPVGSEKEKFLYENRDKFREVAGKSKVDDVFKSKYIAYFGQIIYGYGKDTPESQLQETYNRFQALGIPDADILDLYRDAAVVKVSGNGADKLFTDINNTIGKYDDTQRSTFLYYTIPSMQDEWDDDQIGELLEYVEGETTKGYITRSIRR